jgi:hypothetical protein
MKTLFVIVLSITLFMPLYSQDKENADPQEKAEKSSIDFSRKYFEVGMDAGVGFDNDLLKAVDFFKKNTSFDLNKFGERLNENGLRINADVYAGFFVNVRMQEKWGLGLYDGIDGNIYAYFPKSLFSLISEGNINNQVFSGTIKSLGGVYAASSLSGFMNLGKWQFGIKPAMYAPILYIPGSSGITYLLDTEEGVKLDAEGEIKVYTMDTTVGIANVLGSSGFDLSFEAEYALFPFLNLGANLSHIPLVAGVLQHVDRYTLNNLYLDISSEQLMNDGLNLPNLDFDGVSETCEKKIYRPLRFDAYALYRPLSVNRDLLIIRPNIGITADITDQAKYLNAGLEVQSYQLHKMLFIALATEYMETIWKHRLNLAVNFRAFELDLGASLRSQNFAKSFQTSGVGANVGLRFGW